MLSRASLRAAAPLPGQGGCRLTWVKDDPPVAFRRCDDGVYLVGTAASPVGRDDVLIEITVEEGARLTVRSAASAIAWASAASVVTVDITIESDGHLDWQLQPLVLSGRCHYRQEVHARLAPGGVLRWREEVVLGRHQEQPGQADIGLAIDVDGRTLLRHQVQVGGSGAWAPTGPSWDGPTVLGTHRALGTEVHAGRPTASYGPARCGPGWAWMPLDGPGAMGQAVAPDLVALRERTAQAWSCRRAPLPS